MPWIDEISPIYQSPVPEQEPERQHYFMDKARAKAAELSRLKGRPLTCRINTFGCQMNPALEI